MSTTYVLILVNGHGRHGIFTCNFRVFRGFSGHMWPSLGMIRVKLATIPIWPDCSFSLPANQAHLSHAVASFFSYCPWPCGAVGPSYAVL